MIYTLPNVKEYRLRMIKSFYRPTVKKKKKKYNNKTQKQNKQKPQRLLPIHLNVSAARRVHLKCSYYQQRETLTYHLKS